MITDVELGKRMKARAAAQQAARRFLIEKYKEEYDEFYRMECMRLFEERGLGVPEFRNE